MDDKEITALAREYAEEENPINTYHNHSNREWDIQIDADSAEAVIRFLLRRYYLVEKGKVLKHLIQVRALAQIGCKTLNTTKVDMGTGSEQTIYHLFPEIAKEVEE